MGFLILFAKIREFIRYLDLRESSSSVDQEFIHRRKKIANTGLSEDPEVERVGKVTLF